MAGAAPLVACKSCAALYERAHLQGGQVAVCTRCSTELYRESRMPLDGWIALTLTAIILFAIAMYYPIAHLRVQGLHVAASLPGALLLTWQQNHEIVAIMTGLAAFWMPLTQLLVRLWALMAIRSRRLPGDFALGMRLLHWVEPWSMIPVLLLGIMIAVVKFSSMASITPGPATWSFAALTFLLTALTRLSTRRIWRYAEEAGLVAVSGAPGARAVPRDYVDDAATMPVLGALNRTHADLADCHACGYVQAMPVRMFSRYAVAQGEDEANEAASCGRCGSGVHRRAPDMRARVWALVLAASIVYLPANLLPIMRVRTLVADGNHTILGGVLELWQLDSPDLAIIVFVASIVVPVTKLAILSLLMLRDKWQNEELARSRTRLYRFITFIGQWSMLDVFVVILMSAMANFPGISEVVAGPGAASFGMVVILTMLATHCYDPRVAWDKAPDADGCARTAAVVPAKADPSAALPVLQSASKSSL